MRLTNRTKQAGATGYILLWLLGLPIPILLSAAGLHITLGRKLTGNKIYVVDYICDSRRSLASRFSRSRGRCFNPSVARDCGRCSDR